MAIRRIASARVAAPSSRSARPYPPQQRMRTPVYDRTQIVRFDHELHPGGNLDELPSALGLIGGFRSPASALGLYYCSVIDSCIRCSKSR